MNDSSTNSLQLGTVLNEKWVILEFIGKGGMGEVYRAHQINLKRDVAIKTISLEWLESLEDNEEEIEIGLQRFRNEVHAMAQVRHPNILQIYDYGSFTVKKGEGDASVEYIAMEFIPGGTLRSTMSDEGFYPEEDLTRDWLLNYFLPVLDGVQALHASKIIHRDLKPGNVLMDGKTPKIADFGLARSYQWKPVTQSVDVKGTPAYMSPEHFLDLRRTDHRADIYSLGKILFEAIEGKMTSKTIPFKRAGLPDPDTPFFKKLDQIIQHATTEDRNNRLESVEEFRSTILEAISMAERKSASEVVSTPSGPFSVLAHPRWMWLGIAVATLSVLLMTLWHLLGEPGKSKLPPERPPGPGHEMVQSKPSLSSEGVLSTSGSPALTLTGKDGVTLHLIPEGEVIVPENFGPQAGRRVRVDSFYMDETEVTNHQYMIFLNQNLPDIQVEGGVVKRDEDVWLLLGHVTKGYEPIVYREGRFSIRDQAFHSHPVVRVTAQGAVAYAHFYGRRLPTEVEWLRALTNGRGTPWKPSWLPPEPSGMMTDMESMHRQMSSSSSDEEEPSKLPVSVTNFKPDAYGIRGLAENVNEWGMSLRPGSSRKNEERQYVILPPAIPRHPWEAFSEFGFRTALSIPGQGNKERRTR